MKRSTSTITAVLIVGMITIIGFLCGIAVGLSDVGGEINWWFGSLLFISPLLSVIALLLADKEKE